jgi:hypothetical protein
MRATNHGAPQDVGVCEPQMGFDGGSRRPDEWVDPRQLGHGAFQDDAVNASTALAAPMVPSPIAFQSPCRLEALLCHAHFVERLTAVAHFFVPGACPRFPQYFAGCRRPSDFQRFCLPAKSKGHGAVKFSAEFSVMISPFNELIRGRRRRLH